MKLRGQRRDTQKSNKGREREVKMQEEDKRTRDDVVKKFKGIKRVRGREKKESEKGRETGYEEERRKGRLKKNGA